MFCWKFTTCEQIRLLANRKRNVMLEIHNIRADSSVNKLKTKCYVGNSQHTSSLVCSTNRTGDGVTPLVDPRTPRSNTRGSNPVRSTNKTSSFSESKVLYWLAVGVSTVIWCAQYSCVWIRTHMNYHVRTHVKDPVVYVHVRVRYITETRKDPACTWNNMTITVKFLTGGY